MQNIIEVGSSVLKLFRIKLVTFFWDTLCINCNYIFRMLYRSYFWLSHCMNLQCMLHQSWTWIGSILWLDWIGLNPVTVIPCFLHLKNFCMNRLLLTNV